MSTDNKKQSLIRYFLTLLILVLFTVSSGFLFLRIDLTQENKYTVSPSTSQLLNNLPDVVYVKLYLDGDLPPAYLKLQKEIRELLDEFHSIASDNIQFEIINPSEHTSEKEKFNFYKQLVKKGVLPVSISENQKEGVTQKIIFPGAMVSYRGRELPANFLQSKMGAQTEEIINASIENVEYELTNAIRKLTRISKQKVAFIEGHGEYAEIWVRDIQKAFEEYYDVSRIRLNHRLDALSGMNAIIIAGADSTFDEKDKFIIDQFAMKGGKILWLLDGVAADMDSLQKTPVMIGTAKELNLNDMLFRYGVRILPNLVLDMQSAPIPMISGMLGNQPQRSLMNWNYFPLISPAEKHPIVRNLNAIRFQFVSGMDTIPVQGVKKTVLLKTSAYTRIQQTPARISLQMLRERENPARYNQTPAIVAVLLEGVFPSVFKNRLTEPIASDSTIGYKEQSLPCKMIVVSDADVIRNQVSKANAQAFPLGYDRYSGLTFGNRDFILNCMNYLLEEEGLISLRSREIKLRVLDKNLLTKHRQSISMINLAGPILLISVTGILLTILRRRRFEK
ncbi:MAG: gliding motility-associated ABC transporter substrate-binding protein GldG [Bacteroidota bacterium]|jgi:ABC-2 type transport system permease protein